MGSLFRRRRGRHRVIGSDLQSELDSPIPWMYPWQLTPATSAPIAGPELPSVHDTRLAMIEPVARAAIERAGPEASVLDLGCNEGWFAHRMLEWGAASAVGVDVRELNIRRAELIRDHFEIDEHRLRFERMSVFDINRAQFGKFDVVLVLGLIYHLENPVGALRVAHELTRDTVLVESQLTAQETPIRVGCGQTDVFEDIDSHWAAILEPAAEQADVGNLLSSFGGVVSFVPNRAALLQALEVSGCREVRMLEAPAHLNRQYVEGHRGIAVGRA